MRTSHHLTVLSLESHAPSQHIPTGWEETSFNSDTGFHVRLLYITEGFPVAHHVREREVLGGSRPTSWLPRRLGDDRVALTNAFRVDLSWLIRLLIKGYDGVIYIYMIIYLYQSFAWFWNAINIFTFLMFPIPSGVLKRSNGKFPKCWWEQHSTMTVFPLTCLITRG